MLLSFGLVFAWIVWDLRSFPGSGAPFQGALNRGLSVTPQIVRFSCLTSPYFWSCVMVVGLSLILFCPSVWHLCLVSIVLLHFTFRLVSWSLVCRRSLFVCRSGIFAWCQFFFGPSLVPGLLTGWVPSLWAALPPPSSSLTPEQGTVSRRFLSALVVASFPAR